jgi:dethiobiotin synthetase
MLDLMRALALPVIVAARPGLGTLNHTLLTLHVLRSGGLRPAGVVLVAGREEPWGAIEDDNAATIASLGRTSVLGVLRFEAGLRSPGPLPESLQRAGDEILTSLPGPGQAA